MPARRASLLATIALAAAVGLTGCIQAPPTPPAGTPEESAPETSAAPSPSEDAEPAAASGESAALGSEFAFGEYATAR